MIARSTWIVALPPTPLKQFGSAVLVAPWPGVIETCADFVEKQRAAVSLFEFADAVVDGRRLNRPFFRGEIFAFQQSVRESRAPVD